MITLVYFTTRMPSRLIEELTQAGVQVFEALAVSEVLHLCETEKIDIVVIAADVDDYRAGVITEHQIALRLKPEAMAKDVIAELWQMFPQADQLIQ